VAFQAGSRHAVDVLQSRLLSGFAILAGEIFDFVFTLKNENEEDGRKPGPYDRP
jgi:hypothetical protein